MPDGIVGARREDLHAPVGIVVDRRIGGDHPTERRPARPAIVGCGLPLVPQGIVRTTGEELQPAIGIAPDRDVAGDHPAARCPSAAPAIDRPNAGNVVGLEIAVSTGIIGRHDRAGD